MKLNREDIKSLIKECVQRILEVHGAIDDKLAGIADIIIERMKNGEPKFILTKNEISQFYPYKNCPDNIPVSKERLNVGVVASYSPTERALKVSPSSFRLYSDAFIKSALMHELTHLVNDYESSGGLSRGGHSVTSNTEKEIFVYQILYLFDNSEMQARISQLKWAIKSGEIKTSYEPVTKLNKMLSLINEVDKETYLEYYETFGESDDFGTIIEGLLSERAYYKYKIDGKEHLIHFLTEKEFGTAKASILKTLRKKYAKFKAKIGKIIYDSTHSQGSNASS